MGAARIVQTNEIATATVCCVCGASIHADLDEDGTTLCREFMLLHRTCMGLPDVYEEVYTVDDDTAELDSDDY